jgi:transposase InsO family protein
LNYLISTSQLEKLNAIEKLYNIYPVKPMCRILNISVGTFYNHLNRRVFEPQHITNDNKLRPLVLEVFESSKQRFGSTKIAQTLRKNGHKISNEKAKKLMNELNIKPIFGKKEITIPQNVESKNKYLKNLVGGNFKREVPNQVWVGDVTEIIIQGNKFYICVIIDLFSRKVIATEHLIKITSILFQTH